MMAFIYANARPMFATLMLPETRKRNCVIFLLVIIFSNSCKAVIIGSSSGDVGDSDNNSTNNSSNHNDTIVIASTESSNKTSTTDVNTCLASTTTTTTTTTTSATNATSINTTTTSITATSNNTINNNNNNSNNNNKEDVTTPDEARTSSSSSSAEVVLDDYANASSVTIDPTVLTSRVDFTAEDVKINFTKGCQDTGENVTAVDEDNRTVSFSDHSEFSRLRLEGSTNIKEPSVLSSSVEHTLTTYPPVTLGENAAVVVSEISTASSGNVKLSTVVCEASTNTAVNSTMFVSAGVELKTDSVNTVDPKVLRCNGEQTNSTACLENTTVVTTLQILWDYKAAILVWSYLPMLLLPLGTVGNVLVIWILTSTPQAKASSSSTQGLYFRALAVSDLCLLYSGLLRNWIKYYFHFELRDTHSAVCKLHIFVVYVTGFTSAWFLVAMTSQRALVVTWPHKLASLSTRRVTRVVIGCVVLSSCLLYSHVLYGYDVRLNAEDGQWHCDYATKGYEDFARAIFPPVDLVLSSLTPFFLLFFSNTLLMIKVASSVSEVKRLTSHTSSGSSTAGQRKAVNQRKRMSTSLNLTLICLSAIFLLLTSPISVYLVIEFDLTGAENIHFQASLALAWAITNNLWYANSVGHFYLYCLSGSRFRQQALLTFCGTRFAQQSRESVYELQSVGSMGPRPDQRGKHEEDWSGC